MPTAEILNIKNSIYLVIYNQVNRQKSQVLTAHSLLGDVNSWSVRYVIFGFRLSLKFGFRLG